MSSLADPALANPARRRLLSLAGAAPLVLAAGATVPAQAAETAPAVTGTVCRLTPQVTQGPYWFDPKLNRADVTEGKPGVPVHVAVTVVDGHCRPIRNARVDLWHCDASGVYSGYEGQGDDHKSGAKTQTFLRGAQITDADGKVTFRSIWPGWYEGRTPHMHLKVFLGAHTVLTCQLFVPDALSQYLYDNVPAYRRTGQRDTFNRQDGIAQQGGEAMVAAVKEAKGGYELALIVGVDPAADWKGEGFGPGGPGGPPPGGMGPPPGGMGPPLGGANGRPPGPPPGGFPNGGPPGGPPGGMGGPPHHEVLTGAARLKAIVPGI
jgi:protocatechuate 3,4-dioxygenase beta subunit